MRKIIDLLYHVVFVLSIVFIFSVVVIGIRFNVTTGVSMSRDNICSTQFMMSKTVSPREELLIGKVYTYKHTDGTLITHRLINQQDGMYTFKGDNPITNSQHDAPVERNKVLYKPIYKFTDIENRDATLDECYNAKPSWKTHFRSFFLDKQIVIKGGRHEAY